MRGYTYLDLAARYEVMLCADSCGEPGHRRGWVDDMGLIHWDPWREVRRSTLRRFLMLVWTAAFGHLALGKADKLYHANIFAYKTALHDLGIRFPASLSLADRKRVAMLLHFEPELRRSRVGRWAGLR